MGIVEWSHKQYLLLSIYLIGQLSCYPLHYKRPIQKIHQCRKFPCLKKVILCISHSFSEENQIIVGKLYKNFQNHCQENQGCKVLFLFVLQYMINKLPDIHCPLNDVGCRDLSIRSDICILVKHTRWIHKNTTKHSDLIPQFK